MTPEARIERVFKPESIAFVGATEAKVKWGFIILNNLLSGGYRGKVHPVNPGHSEIMGLTCYPSVLEIPGDVDLALFTVPAPGVVSSMRECAEKGVGSAVVISAGFSETGESGGSLQNELVRIADEAGMAVVGPNGQGICCPASNLYPWMPLFYPPAGSIAFTCQSGNILNMLIGHALDAGLGVSKAVSSGNEAQLKKEDFFRYFAGDDETDVIVSYVEGLEDGRRFFEMSSSATLSKPIVLLKGGRSGPGESAAASHTGAMAVRKNVFEAACRQAGITVAETIREAGLTASAFVNRPLPRGHRVGIVTGGGGLGVIAADACARSGLEVPPLSERTLERIGEMLPDYWVPGNPVDLVAGLDLTVVSPILESMMKSGEVDSVLFIFIESQRTKAVSTIEEGGLGIDISSIWDMMTEHVYHTLNELYGTARETGVPLFVASNFGVPAEAEKPDYSPFGKTMMFEDVESACTAIRALSDYGLYLERAAGEAGA